MSETSPPRATYLLPLRTSSCAGVAELADYLRSLDGLEILVVDGSNEPVFAAVDAAIAGVAAHVQPDPLVGGRNGKARGVLTGLALASCDKIVVADDDVRYDPAALAAVLERLDRYDVVRPQNVFSPAPWHAVYDGARSLVNRAFDGDWPGTLAFRRTALPSGYDADVLFENFELVQTIRRNGGVECVAGDLFVERLPPSTAHFWSQRVRQAYDEFARPVRMGVALSVVPCAAFAVVSRRFELLVALAAMTTIVATIGWLRDGGWRRFSPMSVLCAPLWAMERGVCAWLAVYARLRHGGVRYAGTVVKDAASGRGGRVRWAA